MVFTSVCATFLTEIKLHSAENADVNLFSEDSGTVLRLGRIKLLMSAFWVMMYHLVSRHNAIRPKIPLLWHNVHY